MGKFFRVGECTPSAENVPQSKQAKFAVAILDFELDMVAKFPRLLPLYGVLISSL